MNNQIDTSTAHQSSHLAHPKRWLGLILILYLLLAAAYGAANPLFEAPDENHHYFNVQQIVATGKLPVVTPDSLAQQEAAQPPLYYLLAAWLIAPLKPDADSGDMWPNPNIHFSHERTTQNINAFVHMPVEAWPWQGYVLAVHLLRLLSTFLGLGTLLCMYASGRLLLPAEWEFALLAVGLTAFLPQYLFLHSAISNDSLIIFLSTAVLWQLVRIWQKGVTMTGLVTLGITIGLAILAKMTGLLLLFFVGGVLLLLAWRDGRWRSLLPALGIVVLVTGVVAGWLLWRNWNLYGDVTAVNQFVAFAGGERDYTLAQVWHDMSRVWRSLIAFFGWMTLRPPGWIYAVWVGLVLLSGVGIIGSLWGKIPRSLAIWLQQAWFPAIWLAGWWLLIVAAWLQFMLRTAADQGRLWFPALLPMALALAFGLTRFHRRVIPVLALLLALLTAVAGLFVIADAYKPPARLLAELPVNVIRLDAPMGHGLTLLGAELETETAVPGQPVKATLYWQKADTAIDTPVRELKMLGRNYELAALSHSFHGDGHYPAGLWPVGKIIAESVTIPLASDMRAPTQARLLVNLLDGGEAVEVGRVRVAAVDPAPLVADPLAKMGQGIRLLEAAAPESAQPGDMVKVRLGWQVTDPPGKPLTAFVHLGNATQPPMTQLDAPPLAADYPPTLWQAGDVITDSFVLSLPPDLPDGRYPLHTGFYDSVTGVRLPLTTADGRQPHDVYLIGWLTVGQTP